jgi:hypothetical protein
MGLGCDGSDSGEVLIMMNNGQPWMAKPAAVFFSGLRGQSREHWYSFLENECLKDNGLLCFYDRYKSREVAYFCGLLAERLAAAAEEGDDEDVDKFCQIGAGSEKGESSLASLKAASKG